MSEQTREQDGRKNPKKGTAATETMMALLRERQETAPDLMPAGQSFPLSTVSHEQRIEAEAERVIGDIGHTFAMIPVRAIVPNPFQPRKIFDQGELQKLADSIRVDGVLQDLIVRASVTQENIFELAAGERRWRAALLAGLVEVPCKILKECPDERMKRIGLLENLLRVQLTPLELGMNYQALLEERDERLRPVYTIRSLAELVHQSKDHVDSHLALLRVPPEARKLIEEDPTIPLRIIREIGAVESEADRTLLIEEVRARSLNQADVLAILQQSRQGKKRKHRSEGGEQEPATSLILRAVLQRKLQRDQGTFKKSLQRIEGEWEHLDADGKIEVRTHLEHMRDELHEVIQRHPIERT
jgi:ParB family chromosome partitioning protein